MQFVPVDGHRPLRRDHDAGVVDQGVDAFAVGQHPLGEGADAREIGQVDAAQFQLSAGHASQDVTARGLALVERAHGHRDARAGRGEPGRRLLSRAAVGTGHDDVASGLVGNGVHEILRRAVDVRLIVK